MVQDAMAHTSGKDDFIATLKGKNIDLVLRYTDDGRIYGATYVDHNTRTVLNGSRLGKEFSANALDRWFNNPDDRPLPLQPDVLRPQPNQKTQSGSSQQQGQGTQPTGGGSGQQSGGSTSTHPNHTQGQGSQQRSNIFDDVPTLPGLDLFQVGPGFNAEEEAFYRAMQRRKKNKRRGPKL